MEQIIDYPSLLAQSSHEIGVHLQSGQLHRFMVYLEHLRMWSRSVNLTGITVQEEIVIKHFVDSIACLAVENIKHGARVLDVGTGAGFPGIPLKIVRDDLHVTLLEPIKKKVSFLYSIVGLLHLQQVNVFYGTLEKYIGQFEVYRSFDYITTRALKYDVILSKGPALLAENGKAIIYSAKPLNRSGFGRKWFLVAEYGFDLPMGFGPRVISILGNSSRQTG